MKFTIELKQTYARFATVEVEANCDLLATDAVERLLLDDEEQFKWGDLTSDEPEIESVGLVQESLSKAEKRVIDCLKGGGTVWVGKYDRRRKTKAHLFTDGGIAREFVTIALLDKMVKRGLVVEWDKWADFHWRLPEEK